MTNPSHDKLKDAQRALMQDQLDDARGLLLDSQVRKAPAGQALASQVAQRIARRAESHVRRGDTSAAWRDLNGAREISPDDAALAKARESIVSTALDEVEHFLENNDADAALAKLNKLHQRNVAGGRAAVLRQVALKARRADRLRRVGKFEDAASNWTAAQKLREDMNVFSEFATVARSQAIEGKGLIDQLQQSMSAKDWASALQTANRLLEMAPQHPYAREAREEAWSNASANLTDSQRKRQTAPWRRANPVKHDQASPLIKQRLAETQAVTGIGKCDNRRLQLWIDSVGGYLVCLGDDVTLGQAVPGATVDIPVFGNLTREHATIRRDGEGYIVTPLANVTLGGKPLQGPTFLSDGDELQLGDSVRFRFRQPHALSQTARLEPLSGHRTQPAADAVLLMAESLVMGRKLNDHVVCRDWPEETILFRSGDEIHCRSNSEFEIDGHLSDGEGTLAQSSHVCGENFSLSVEEI